MKTKLSIFTIILSLFIFLSCNVEPKEINYGNDHCHFCDMTVVDKTHAAEYVTTKGRAYMFDAVECLVMDINKNKNEDQLSFVLVADYANPGELVNAKEATYLISEKIKSPMGANLSAFGSKETALKTQIENGGKLFSWEELKAKFSKYHWAQMVKDTLQSPLHDYPQVYSLYPQHHHFLGNFLTGKLLHHFS